MAWDKILLASIVSTALYALFKYGFIYLTKCIQAKQFRYVMDELVKDTHFKNDVATQLSRLLAGKILPKVKVEFNEESSKDTGKKNC